MRVMRVFSRSRCCLEPTLFEQCLLSFSLSLSLSPLYRHMHMHMYRGVRKSDG